jgi:hypothetical protein
MQKSAAALLFFAATAAAQTGTTPASSHVETTVSLGIDAQLTASRVQIIQNIGISTESVNTQSLDLSPAILGSIRRSIRPWLGYTANLGYARTTEVNTGTLGANASPYLAIPSNVYETSVAYHLQNHITPRLTGFVDVGAGALTFLPVHRGEDARNFAPPKNPALAPSVSFRPLGVGSVGIDYHFNHRLALRAEYRGLIYKYPDFDSIVGRSVTITSQPTVSLAYQFGRKH